MNQLSCFTKDSKMSTDDTPLGYIYLIECKANNKKYIGQTRQLLKDRIRFHRSIARNPKNPNHDQVLYRDIRLYGWANFTVTKLCEVSKFELNSLEMKYIKEYDCKVPNGYNIDDGGGVNPTTSETARNNYKQSAKKRIIKMTEKEKKAYFDKLTTSRLENPLSDESKKQISKSLKEYNSNNPVQQTTRDKMSSSRRKTQNKYPTYMMERFRSGRMEYIINRHPLCRYKRYLDVDECFMALDILNIQYGLQKLAESSKRFRECLNDVEKQIYAFRQIMQAKINNLECSSETQCQSVVDTTA